MQPMFSIPAATRIRGQRVRGFFNLQDGAVQFIKTP